MKFDPKTYETMVIALIVIFGAIVHATSQLKIARDGKKTYTGLDFTINFTIACFAGIIFGMASTLFFDNNTAISLFGGVGAFLGLTGLNKFSTSLLEFLVTKIDKK